MTPSRSHIDKKICGNKSAAGYEKSELGISDEVLDSVAGVTRIESYSYFNRTMNQNGSLYIEFNPIEFVIMVDVPHDVLRGKIHVSVVNGDLRDATFTCKSKSELFNEMFSQHLPPHVALVSRTSATTKMGKVDEHSCPLKFYMRCIQNKNRNLTKKVLSKNASASQNKTCTTTAVAGIPTGECIRFAEGDMSRPVRAVIKFTGSCVHLFGQSYGVLKGRKREKLGDEVTQVYLCAVVSRFMCVLDQFYCVLCLVSPDGDVEVLPGRESEE